MRKLVITRGLPGSGKSTWLKNHKLDKYTISADNIRLLYKAPIMTDLCNDAISQEDNEKIWNIIYEILEERMKNGDFTIIDATHINTSRLSIYKKLAEKYRYRLYCLDFTNIELSTILEQNKNRPDYQYVPENVIINMNKQLEENKLPKYFKLVSPNSYIEDVSNGAINGRQYEYINVIGDIKGCYSTFEEFMYHTSNAICNRNTLKNSVEYVVDLLNPDELYIFTGNYFGEGLENSRVAELLKKLSEKKNVLMLIGRNENYMWQHLIMNRPLRKELKTILEDNINKDEFLNLYRSMAQLLYINLKNKTLIITHSGIPYIPNMPLDYYSTDSIIKGIGGYECNVDDIFNSFCNTNKIYSNIIQIHGSRNFFSLPVLVNESSINLECQIEYGGYLRCARIDTEKEEIRPYEIKNEIYNTEIFGNRTLVDSNDLQGYILQLSHNKFIKEKDLGNGVYSYNFIKMAFEKGVWSNITTKARGLFIDKTNCKIQARSYDKFFNKNERDETNLEKIADKLKYPVDFFLKYNGFLGILSVRNNELYFCTKSTDSGEHVEIFKDNFYNKYNLEVQMKLKNKLKELDASAIFEIVDNEKDPHIIGVKEPQVVLLDIIYNTIDFKNLPYKELKQVSKDIGLFVKEKLYTANNPKAFLSINDIISSNNYKYSLQPIEGLVMKDSNNFMIKFKTHYYNTWKYCRTLMNSYLINPNEFKMPKLLPKEVCDFILFVRKKYPNGGDPNKTNIIIERTSFEKFIRESNLHN